MSSWLVELHLVLDRDKGKVKPGEFPNLATPEATSVDHSDHDLIFIWSKVKSCSYTFDVNPSCRSQEGN